MEETEVQYYAQIFAAEQQANTAARQRELEDWRFYKALDNGQWTPEAVVRMEQQRRPVLTFDLITKHVDTEAGMLLQNPFEFKFEADYGQNDEHAILANELMLRDKDLGSWAHQKTLFVRDGLVNTGVLEMFVDDTRDKLGAINYRRRIPGQFTFDSNWQSTDPDDCRQIFEARYLDPEAIKRIYGRSAGKLEEIDSAIALYRAQRQAGKLAVTASMYPGIQLERNGQFLVIQYMELQYSVKNRLYNPITGAWLDIDFPDASAREDFLALSAQQGVYIKQVPVQTKTCHVRTFAPALSLTAMLGAGPHPLRIEHYPLVVWSAYNVDGERYGRVAKYKDPQSVYNKRIATFLHWQMTASNGAKLIGPGAFDSDDEKARYIEEHNIPGSVFDVLDPNQIVNDARDQVPTDLLKIRDDAKEFFDIAGAPPAAQGQGEKAGESGVLYNARREQAAVAMESMNQGLEACEHRLGELYLLALPQVYRGVPRVWRSKKDGRPVFLNTDEANDVSRIGRMSVRITQAPVGASVKRENLAIMSQLRQSAKNPLEDSALALQTIHLLPGIDEETKSAMREDIELMHEVNRLQATATVLTLRQQVAAAMAAEQAGALAPGQSGAMVPGGMTPAPGLPPAAAPSLGAPGASPPTGQEQPVGALSNG